MRLGAVARSRRNEIGVTDGVSIEDKVVAWLAARAMVSERLVTSDELRELAT
ncbi:MAG: hypothetical protein ABSG41_23020 [Bryobacteraceae bacterium]